MRSAWVPLLGIIAVWLFYVCFALVRPSSEARTPSSTVASSPASLPGVNVPVAPPRSSRSDRSDRTSAQQQPPGPVEAKPEASTEGEGERGISAEDKEFLAAFAACSGTSDLAALEAFVAGHPEHTLGRVALISALFGQGAAEGQQLQEAAIREHLKALQALVPELGLPDLLQAHLEQLAGNADVARELLLAAARKDRSWLPQSEIIRLRIADELSAGRKPTETLASIMATDIQPFLILAPVLRGFLDAEAQADPTVRAETARALFSFGAAMQENGLSLIENLVGHSTVARAATSIQGTGELSAEEQLLLKRGQSLLGEARIEGDVVIEVLADPAAARRYLENLAAHGERRAARRALMDYLVRDTRWR